MFTAFVILAVLSAGCAFVGGLTNLYRLSIGLTVAAFTIFVGDLVMALAYLKDADMDMPITYAMGAMLICFLIGIAIHDWREGLLWGGKRPKVRFRFEETIPPELSRKKLSAALEDLVRRTRDRVHTGWR